MLVEQAPGALGNGGIGGSLLRRGIRVVYSRQKARAPLHGFLVIEDANGPKNLNSAAKLLQHMAYLVTLEATRP
ncbi:MAG: hypothetical protein M3131_05765 [Actinomycetota bacterium]|nr:hypothetical protein [Actinomycetota bacterium]